jgi:hypothetical protein
MNLVKDKKFTQLLALSRNRIILLLGIQSEIFGFMTSNKID